jgi:hypothetical protein
VRMRLFALCFIVVLLFITSTAAQSPNGTVSGIILDPSGAVIAGADIVIVNDATGVQYSSKTNSDGIYVVPNLPPGPYRIQVSNSGFKTIIKPDIVIHVQDALAINFTLPIGAASEVVTVEGGAPLVKTESGSVGTVIDRRFVESLPLNGRSFNTLLQLTPGVVIAVANGAVSPGQFSIAGQRTDANNFLIDGVSANFGATPGYSLGQSGTGTAQAFSAIGGTSSLVSVEALQEFRVETSSFAPEFGRSAGGQVILTTRSGTNDFHGGIYEYFRNDILDANDWFANATPGQPHAAERHNDFGGFMSGPVLKDRTFFFISYEGARLRLPQSLVVSVPSGDARASAPASIAPFLNAYPIPNGTVSPGTYVAKFTGTFSNTATLDAGSVRIDHTFSDRFSIFGRYNEAPSGFAQRVGSLSMLQFTDVATRTLTLGATMVFSSRLADTFRGNYSAQHADLVDRSDSFGGAVPLDASLLLSKNLSSSENGLFFETYDTAYYETGPQARNRTKQLNLANDLTVTADRHQVKIGEDYRVIYLNTASSEHALQVLSPSVQSFVSTGTGNLYAATYKPSAVVTRALSLYAQDNWKFTPRLTLVYGLRWELSPAPSARGETTLAAWENVNNPSEITLAPSGTLLWRTTYSNLAPRVGIAYRLTQEGDFVLRAGWGLFYDLGVGSSANLAVYFPNYTYSYYPGVSLPVGDVSPYLPVISVQPPYPGGVYAVAPNLKQPRSYQWNVALEKSFAGTQIISMTYVGQAGRDLLRQEALFQPNPNFRGEFILDKNDARSNYNALQLQYRRSLTSRLQALLNYSWSHSLDNASNDVVAGVSNTVISERNDYASSDFDVRQSFSGALTYDIPGVAKSGALSLLTRDWSLDAIIVARSGFPFNALVFGTSPDPGGYALTRPDVVPGQFFWIENASAPGGKSMNPSAFSVPSSVRQGTEGRNNISGFGLTQVDVSVARKFPMGDRLSLQFRVDAFNVFNHPNFANPEGYIQFGTPYLESRRMLNQGLQGLNPLFQEGGPRSLQLSLKLVF